MFHEPRHEGQERKTPEMLFQEYLGETNPVWKNKPIEFVLKLQEEETSPEAYETFIPILRRQVLPRVNLLERYQLALRGDCLSQDELDKFFDSIKCTSAVRTKNISPINIKEKKRILIHVLAELIERARYAYHYAEQSEKEKRQYKNDPTILYTFKKTSDIRELFVKPREGNEIFYGQADDIGITFENTHVFKLPTNPFLLLPTYRDTLKLKMGQGYQSSRHGSRIKEVWDMLGGSGYSVEKIIDMPHAQTYFNALLLADQIFKDIEEYDRIQNEH